MRLGFWELVLILLVLLLIFGGSRLPQLGRAVGGMIKEFKSGFGGGDTKGDEPKKGSN